jgi:3,4-dihydroxy 2-butanone 4-phosphate synthase/GTP cyclohydrolase II
MRVIAQAECGVIVFLHRNESSVKLIERIQLKPSDRPDLYRSDLRDHGIGAQILKNLNVGKMRLLATPRKMPSVTGFGLEVTSYVNIED